MNTAWTGPDPTDRSLLIDTGVKATITAMAFAAAALALRVSGLALALALLGCGASIVAMVAVSRSSGGLRSLAAGRPVQALSCVAIAVGAVALGIHGGLLFLPGLFLLLTISVRAEAGFLSACSVMVASGFLFPAIAAGEVGWSEPCAAAALVLLPMTSQRLLSGVSQRPEPRPATPNLPELTPRQAEVAALLATGMRHQEIADRLGVSVHQVRRLIRQARERTGARNATELIAVTMSPAADSQAE